MLHWPSQGYMKVARHDSVVTTSCCVWQNHLNYSGSSAQAITIKATPAPTHFKWNNSWSVGFSDTTTGSRIEQAYPARRRVQRYYNHMFYNTSSVVITTSSRHYYKTKLSKTVVQTIIVSSEFEKQWKEKTTATTRRKSIPG